jgi:CARDB protein
MTRAGLNHRAIPILLVASSLVAVGADRSTARAGGLVVPGRPVASGAQVAAGAGPQAPFSSRLLTCRRSPLIERRTVAVAARMRPIAGGTHLSLRVQLYQRPLTGRHWTLRSDVPGLGEWISPADPTLGSRPADVFAYHQAVGRLVVPYAYRFRVSFRWLDDAGKVVRQEHTTTRPCREPDLRPDLTLPSVQVEPSLRFPGYARYVVKVRNVGRSTARHITVGGTFPVHPTSSSTRTIRRLRVGESVTVSFVAPKCAASDSAPPSFVADPANAIEEMDETNNTAVAACA